MIKIVDYNAGNLTSVKRALDFLQIPCQITPDADEIATAERIIFPGVGNATSAMETIKARGLDKALKTAFANGTPIMGICLGTQIILSHSDEENTSCLGLIEGNCPMFELSDKSLKIPHMGWNAVIKKKEHAILKDLNPGDELYFVHSYYPQPADESAVYAVAEYEIEFPAVIGKDNLVAAQFHPEKSGRIGLQMLKNFSEWDGKSC